MRWCTSQIADCKSGPLGWGTCEWTSLSAWFVKLYACVDKAGDRTFSEEVKTSLCKSEIGEKVLIKKTLWDFVPDITSVKEEIQWNSRRNKLSYDCHVNQLWHGRNWSIFSISVSLTSPLFLHPPPCVPRLLPSHHRCLSSSLSLPVTLGVVAMRLTGHKWSGGACRYSL